jgi:hypothetical protein
MINGLERTRQTIVQDENFGLLKNIKKGEPLI